MTAVAYGLLLLVEEADMSQGSGIALVLVSQCLQCVGGVMAFLMCSTIVVSSVPESSLSTTNAVLGTTGSGAALSSLSFAAIRSLYLTTFSLSVSGSVFYSIGMSVNVALVHLGDEREPSSCEDA